MRPRLVPAPLLLMPGRLRKVQIKAQGTVSAAVPPGHLVGPGIVFGIGSSAWLTSVGVGQALVGAVLGGGLFLLMAVLSVLLLHREGMGEGTSS